MTIRNGWVIKVCPQTVATRIVLQSGPSRDNNGVWGEWKRDNGQDEFRLPEEQQSYDKLYFQLNNPEEQQAEICILYDRQVKKHFSFDSKHNQDDVAISDSDDCPC